MAQKKSQKKGYGGEVAEMKANCKEIVKVCVLDVYQSFYNDQGHVFISRTNRVLADHGKYIFDAKGKYS